jgi:ATP-dependent Clp protease protease subunit
MLKDEVCEDSINPIIAQLLFLNNEDSEKPIYLYIDSPGGSCTAGLALIDIINFISAPVYTVCLGLAASMGAAILSCGTKRFALPNSTVMCHQVSGGFKGTIMDHEVNFEYEKKLNERLMKIIADNCKMDYKKFMKAVDRDKYMFAEDALKFGIVDEILTSEIREEE